MNTQLEPNVVMNFNSQSYFIYKTTVQTGVICEFGVADSGLRGINMYLGAGYITINEFVADARFTSTTVAGAYILNRNNSNDKQLFRNALLFETKTNAASNNTLGNLYLGARNFNGNADNYSNSQTRFFSVGDGITDTEASNFYTAVHAFQTTLSRQV
jgi:hypothetical protein